MNHKPLSKSIISSAALTFLMFASFFGVRAQNYATTYQVKGDTIVAENTGRYNNRPLYINNTNAFILAGDQPLICLAKDDKLFGNLIITCKRGVNTIQIADFSQVTSMYVPGQMIWRLSDKRFDGLKLELTTLPSASGTGMVTRILSETNIPGDQLNWSFGGEKQYKDERLSWNFDVMGHPELLKWSDSDHPDQNPRFQGSVVTKPGRNSFYLFFSVEPDGNIEYKTGQESENEFVKAQQKLEKLQGRLKINTPDSYLNAEARSSVIAVDGTWYAPVFVHGCMQWNVRLPGWRTIFGGTMFGWHDRVKEEAKFYIDAQIKQSDKQTPKADPTLLLTGQAPESRFYGVGRIDKDQNFYDMQTQFFDQLIEEYRWTNDPELVKILREALELHLVWIRDCFDPDGDGVYESYLNSWPTDSQWYNGGGTAEETAYAYRGHLAARDMARNAGDATSEKYHNQMLKKIKNGFFSKLWIQDKGYSGAYREQGGHQRLHQDPWLYSIFLPIDAGLTSQLQSIESVYYSEWALQNDKLPYGGRQVWTSNWIPGIWSVRELWPGDNYALALSYFQSGLPNDGYDIFRGTYMRTAFNHLVPGNLGGIQGGIDFGDCTHTFARTLVEGLFGYNPDYPNGVVKIAPQFPVEWNYASIELPDIKIDFRKSKNKIQYSVDIKKAANLELLLPVQCKQIRNVTNGGRPVKWELIPGIGQSRLRVQLLQTKAAEIEIESDDALQYFAPEPIEAEKNTVIKLEAKDAKVVAVEDPQKVLENITVHKGTVVARLIGAKGYHTVALNVLSGKAPQIRVFRIKINDPDGDARQAERFVSQIPSKAEWENVSIRSLFNADVTTIYQQKYLSPRPNTVSARLGTDGYSPWTFPYWKSLPPAIKLDNLPDLLKGKNSLVTPQGVPFQWNSEEKNVAFTSMWDNYPARIDFPVNKSGDAIWFLVSGSTNVMQCQIANAVIRLNYADGQVDSLELIPPVNYWNLSTIDSHATAPGQFSRTDYTSETDKFCLPEVLPQTVQLGENCRAMLLNLKMRKNVELKSVTLETLSQEVVVGLMGVTIMKE